MPGIDDPIDAVKKQYADKPSTALEVILEVAGKFYPLVGLASIIQKFFSKQAASERVTALFEAIEFEVRRQEKELKEIVDKIESPEFVETLIVAVNETLQSASKKKVARYAAVLGYSLTAESSAVSWEDVSAYIIDLSQLGESDLEALKILYSAQSKALSEGNFSTDPNPFTALLGDVHKAVDQFGMSRDEFYSRCSRLGGFGLCLEVQRNDVRMGPGDHCFRLTGRGKKLISMISHLDNAC